MRLIDADRFYINYARRFSREPLKVEFLKQFLDAEPTVCDIEQIRAEIDDLDIHFDNDYFSENRDAMLKRDEVLQIIDRHTR